MKLGILGGTFNPPHVGHLIVAEYARQKLALAKILFIPAGISPHKRGERIPDSHHRMEMLRLAIAGNPSFEPSDIEIKRGGVSYTVDTLAELRAERPNEALVLLIGLDNLADFHTWREPEKILQSAQVVVMTRPGVNVDALHRYGSKVAVCEVPEIGISSSDIRDRVARGESIRYLVPDGVREYIVSQGLYHTLEK
jgi:nicotinate-nucleotide adenylyltransferase